MAPHFGHLTCVSLDIPVHPKKQITKIAIAKKMLTCFLIPIRLLSLGSRFVIGMALFQSIISLLKTLEEVNKGCHLAHPQFF
jgi:hypothetical protein